MVRVKKEPLARICQGDVLRHVEYIEYVAEKSGVIEVSKIVFPLVIVLTQDCDLEQDNRDRQVEQPPRNQDKWLLSILVAPLYNAEHVYDGEHLSELNMTMEPVKRSRTPQKYLKTNQRLRYHYIEFPEEYRIAPSVIDFKHYFAVNARYLQAARQKHLVYSVPPLFREDISHRFAAYLSRIGLPVRDRAAALNEPRD